MTSVSTSLIKSTIEIGFCKNQSTQLHSSSNSSVTSNALVKILVTAGLIAFFFSSNSEPTHPRHSIISDHNFVILVARSKTFKSQIWRLKVSVISAVLRTGKKKYLFVNKRTDEPGPNKRQILTHQQIFKVIKILNGSNCFIV